MMMGVLSSPHDLMPKDEHVRARAQHPVRPKHDTKRCQQSCAGLVLGTDGRMQMTTLMLSALFSAVRGWDCRGNRLVNDEAVGEGESAGVGNGLSP